MKAEVRRTRSGRHATRRLTHDRGPNLNSLPTPPLRRSPSLVANKTLLPIYNTEIRNATKTLFPKLLLQLHELRIDLEILVVRDR